MFIFLGIPVDLLRLRLRDIPGKDANHRAALGVYGQHNLDRFFSIHAKETLKNVNHELHWRVIVVEQYDLVQGWALELGLGLFFDSADPAVFVTIWVTLNARPYPPDSTHHRDLNTPFVALSSTAGDYAGQAGQAIASMMASPKAEQLTSVAPSIRRSKS